MAEIQATGGYGSLLAQLRVVFEHYDKDGNGKWGVTELEQICKDMDLLYTSDISRYFYFGTI